jgi:YidC/Oxa1 family membrane protein insertase
LPDYHNPQQEPGTERRLLLVFAITFLVILASQALLQKYMPKPAVPPEPQQAVQPTQAQIPPTPAVSSAVPAAGNKQASAESEVVVENDFYRIRFSNRGGVVKSWVLKKYDDDQRQPLELVNNSAAAKYGFPLSLWTYDANLRNKLNSTLYVASTPEGTLHAPGEITFEYADQELVVRKTFRFDQSYLIRAETSVRSKGTDVQAYLAWPAGFGDESSLASYAAGQIEYQFNDKIERLAIKKISGGATVNGPFHWAAVADQYFTTAFLPDDPQNAAMVMLHEGLDVPKDRTKPDPNDTVKVDVLGLAVGNRGGPTSQRVFVGPKALELLESVPVSGMAKGVEPDLRGIVNFGFFGIIARPLFLWLKWTYHHMVPNWGWAIAIQTIIINLALLPLRISSMKSALRMQKLAPQIKSIQEKYKKYSMRDPKKQEMQQEIAGLYKKEGVNPVGGCLPMLVQMPFLIAYYTMLGAAIDLRHAPWLWVRDLSAADPYKILPIAVILSTLAMQKMTPQAGMDPAQQKMMTLMMPVMLGFVSWNIAAGLCIYWVLGSIIGIVQQAVMNQTSLGREMREMMEKRARKKASS